MLFAIASCPLFPRGYLRQLSLLVRTRRSESKVTSRFLSERMEGLVYDPGRFASGQLVDTEINQRSVNQGRRTCDQ